MDEPVKPRAFKPSEVNVFANFPPFVDTFEKTECECAVVYIVCTLAESGDAWRPITWGDCSKVCMAAFKRCDGPDPHDPTSKPSRRDRLLNDLAKNPFAKPDFHKLAKLGYARWLGEPGGTTPLELTEKGIEKLRRWVREPDVV